MNEIQRKLIENERSYSVIDNLIFLYSNEVFKNIDNHKIIIDLIELRDRIRMLDKGIMNITLLIPEIINEKYHDIYSELTELERSLIGKNKSFSETDLSVFKKLTNRLQIEIRRTNAYLNNYIHKTRNIYNSETFYDERIRELETQKKELLNYLSEQKNIQAKSEEEDKEKEELIKRKEKALLKANEQIRQYQIELDEKKKKDNAIDEWNSKIKSTFEELTTCLTPMKDEHNRLNTLFWIYSGLTLLVITTIILLEVYIFCKLHNSTGFPEWKNYFAAITPIPVFGGLLWAFIIQLNRTQRQLVILAKHIHEIKYVEGLLLSVNSLSLDINESTKRVNWAIDRLLDNHLNNNSNSITEQGIIQEEKKDYVPIDTVLKLLKEIKGIVEK